MSYAKKGFTLIELLIVIAIIGILASILLVSLGGARAAARDARRIADLRQVQGALELYYNKCGKYPGNSGALCDIPSGITDPDNGNDIAGWSQFSQQLILAGIGITAIPVDPTNSATYRYQYDLDTSDGQKYVLGATLEKANQALDNDVDTPAFGATMSCTDPVYCVQS